MLALLGLLLLLLSATRLVEPEPDPGPDPGSNTIVLFSTVEGLLSSFMAGLISANFSLSSLICFVRFLLGWHSNFTDELPATSAAAIIAASLPASVESKSTKAYPFCSPVI